MVKYKPHFNKIIGIGSVGWLYMMARRQNIKKADEFLHGWATGEDLTAGNPILALRGRLNEAARARDNGIGTMVKPKVRLMRAIGWRRSWSTTRWVAPR